MDIVVQLHADTNRKGVMRVDDVGLSMFFKKRATRPDHVYSWSQVRGVSFDDPGRTKASVGAIVALGVVGMAARRSFTIVTVSLNTEDVLFHNDYPAGSWHAMARRIVEDVPAARGRIFVDGTQVGMERTMQQSQAGWYPDANSPGTLRWFDGAAWTNHTAPPG